MGGSDGNAQQRACCSPTLHRDGRYWWPIWGFLLEVFVLNAYILYKLDWPDSKANHREFQSQCGLALVTNPVGQTKQGNDYAPIIREDLKYPDPARTQGHTWKRLLKRKTCSVCKANRTMRTPLKPIDGNSSTRKRLPMTRYGCNHCHCREKAICHNPKCWKGAHSNR